MCLFLGTRAVAQMDTACLTGRVEDPWGKSVKEAMIELADTDRNAKLRAHTDNSGLYIFPNVRPGHYRMQVSAVGYKTVDLRSMTLHTEDDIQQNFTLTPGPAGDSVTLMANATPVQTTGAVVTVGDRELVGELPLNGRSFQTLFQLVPGVVIAPTSFASQGQFAVNGQRTDANYFVIDGVSANFAIAAGVNPGQSAGGWLPALTVFGGTNSLVSTDAVQEFAVLTSSYSAEFGRVPGGQISIVTESGANKFAGSLVEYLRNDVFDANDWFANNEGLPRAELRQNDFGGVLGGPFVRDKTFFFVSFEGLELRQPTSRVTDVPSLMARSLAPSAVKPLLDAYPLPNGQDIGQGLAQASYGFSNPSSLDAFSLRVDHRFRESLSSFVRYAYSVSDVRQRGAGSDALSTVTDTRFALQTITAGVEYSISSRTINDVRFNWSESSAESKKELDKFGGAIPVAQQLVFPSGINVQTGLFQFFPTLTPQTLEMEMGNNVSNTEGQINLVDDVSCQIHGNLIKAGVDFRQLSPEVTPPSYQQQSFFQDIESAVANTGLVAELLSSVPVRADFRNYSAFVEDTWRAPSRLSATVGVRWDFAPAPSVRGSNGLQPFPVTGFSKLPELSLAPQGTLLYHSPLNNFAPRIGFAYETRRSPRAESVIKGGAGVYYDLGNGPAGNTLGGFSFPFAAASFVMGTSLPLGPSIAAAPLIASTPPFSLVQAFPSVLRTPYSYHWNFSIDQAVGASQTLSVSYVGAAGHSLLRTEEYIGGEAGVPKAFNQILLTDNAGYSNFNSLQAKLERRAGQVHLIASYALGHLLDNVSTDADFNGIPGQFVNPRRDYGPSDFDIRHSASLGLDYTLPQMRIANVARSLISGWSIDSIMMCRSSPPVNPVVSRDIGFGDYDFRPDLNPGVPLYLYDANLPGGRMINPSALSLPAGPTQGNLGRNFFRGFPLFQTDLAVQRSFHLGERSRLQARVEGFNIFNHANFGPPAAQLGVVDPAGNFVPQSGFGISSTTLAQGLQRGSFGSGFSPLYQVGAARSLQLALKIQF